MSDFQPLVSLELTLSGELVWVDEVEAEPHLLQPLNPETHEGDDYAQTPEVQLADGQDQEETTQALNDDLPYWVWQYRIHRTEFRPNLQPPLVPPERFFPSPIRAVYLAKRALRLVRSEGESRLDEDKLLDRILQDMEDEAANNELKSEDEDEDESELPVIAPEEAVKVPLFEEEEDLYAASEAEDADDEGGPDEDDEETSDEADGPSPVACPNSARTSSPLVLDPNFSSELSSVPSTDTEEDASPATGPSTHDPSPSGLDGHFSSELSSAPPTDTEEDLPYVAGPPRTATTLSVAGEDFSSELSPAPPTDTEEGVLLLPSSPTRATSHSVADDSDFSSELSSVPPTDTEEAVLPVTAPATYAAVPSTDNAELSELSSLTSSDEDSDAELPVAGPSTPRATTPLRRSRRFLKRKVVEHDPDEEVNDHQARPVRPRRKIARYV